MGRRRTNQRHLPPRMQLRHGAYYHVTTRDGTQRWTRLAPASDYGRIAPVSVSTIPGFCGL